MFLALSRHSATLHQGRPCAEPLDAVQDLGEQRTWYSYLSHLEDYIPGVRDHLRANLDQLLPQGGQAIGALR